jgi:Rieske Fe-S protein
MNRVWPLLLLLACVLVGAPLTAHAAQGELNGRLLRVHPTSGTDAFILVDADGRLYALVSSPQLEGLAITPIDADQWQGTLVPLLWSGQPAALQGLAKGGLAVAVKGTPVRDDGPARYTVDSVQVTKDSKECTTCKYPRFGRCVHCGCRMELDSAKEAEGECQMCDCHKKASECYK